MKTSELKGVALDWAVAKCEGECVSMFAGLLRTGMFENKNVFGPEYAPSTDWLQGGPIIEREELCVGYKYQCDPNYCPINDPATNCWARTTAGGYISYGPTPLIAAMRCLVASKQGGEVDVPEGLL